MAKYNTGHAITTKCYNTCFALENKNGIFLVDGGGGLNVGLRRAFEDELLKDVYVANYPQFNGAIGAARLAQEQYQE